MYLMRRRGLRGYGNYGSAESDAAWKKAYESQHMSAIMRGLLVGAGAAAGNAVGNWIIGYFFQPKKKKAFKVYSVVTTALAGSFGFWAGHKKAKNDMMIAYTIDTLSSPTVGEELTLEQELPEETTVEVVPGSEDVEIIQG